MALTQAELQAEARTIGGTAGQFNEDLHAAFDVLGVTQDRQINERMIEFTGASTASAAYALLLENGFDPFTADLLLISVGNFLLINSAFPPSYLRIS